MERGDSQEETVKRRRCRGPHFSPIWTGLNLHEDPIPVPSLTDATPWFQSWVAVFLLSSLGKNLIVLLTVFCFFFFSPYTDLRKTTLVTCHYKRIQDHERLWKSFQNRLGWYGLCSVMTCYQTSYLKRPWALEWCKRKAMIAYDPYDPEITSLHAREQNLPFSLSRKASIHFLFPVNHSHMGQLWACVSSYMQKDRNIAFLWACYTAMWCSRGSIEYARPDMWVWLVED